MMEPDLSGSTWRQGNEYFEYLLTKLPKYLNQTDRSFLEDLLPWLPKLPDRIRKPVKTEPQAT